LVIIAEQLSLIDYKEERVIEPGWFTVAVGGKQPGFTGSSDSQFTGVATARLRLTGREVRIKE
jgi:beta-glucosidase